MRSAIIILAAGASTRLGRPKQLVAYRGTTLLRYAIHQAIASGTSAVIAVLGANEEIVRPTIEDQPVSITDNLDWEAGIGTSVFAGMMMVKNVLADADNVLLMVCDQPAVDAGLLREMQTVYTQSGKGIVACGYGDTVGVPVLFGRNYFDELLALPDDAGAKMLLKLHSQDVAVVAFPDGVIDVDTNEDVERMSSTGD